MNILFLDDDNYRIESFKTKIKGATIVKTASAAIEAIQSQDIWNIVFLDHDLGGETFVDSDREDCGMEVACWIAENQPNIRNIIVHSLNKPAADQMVAILKDSKYRATYIPFSLLIQNLEMTTNV